QHLIKSGLSRGATALVLADPGESYAIYIYHGRLLKFESFSKPLYEVDGTSQQAKLAVDLPAGSYAARWVNTKTGAIDKTEHLESHGSTSVLTSPSYAEDIALRIIRQQR